jgi:hypothetical protein
VLHRSSNTGTGWMHLNTCQVVWCCTVKHFVMTLYVLCMRLMGSLNVTAVIAFLGRDTLGGKDSAE